MGRTPTKTPSGELWQIALGHAVRAARIRARMSQADLKDAAGVDLKTISQIELAMRDPSVGTLRKIARALKVEIGALFLPENALLAEATLPATDSAPLPASDSTRRLAARVDALERELLETAEAQRELLVAVQRLEGGRSGARSRRGTA